MTEENKIPLFVRNPLSQIPKKGAVLFRATIPFLGFDENLVSYYHHPPENYTRNGRCHIPKYPVFYCSDICAISLAEAVQFLLPLTNSTVYISEWETIVDKRWALLSFIFRNVPPENPAYEYVRKTEQDVRILYKKFLPQHQIDEYIQLYHSEFTNPVNHKFSSVVSYQFHYENDQGDGDIIFYPSVQVGHLGNNYAIHPRYIERHDIVLKKIYKVHFESIAKVDSSKYDMVRELRSVGTTIDNIRVDWNDPSDTEQHNLQHQLLPLF